MRRLTRAGGAGLALVVAVALLAASAAIHRAEPRPDAFYDAPDEVPAQPGVLLRSVAYSTGIPESARAWRILYTSTRDDQTPVLASAIVVVGRDAPAGPRPVIAWAHGTTGWARKCAPSILDTGLASGALPALDRIVDNGWVLVATDYTGLGTEGPHPYMIGQGEGRSTLDAVRAAKQLDEVSLADQTVVWGHSQGGHAALWTGQLAGSYAPDVDVLGVAALAPASDLVAIIDNFETLSVASIFTSFMMQAYTRIYPDVDFDDYVRPTARIQLREMASRCLSEPGTLVSVVSSLLFDKSVLNRDPSTGPLGARLAQNTPTGPIDVPLFVAQGETDNLILPSMQDGYVKQRCSRGGDVDYRIYRGRDHIGLVADDSPLIPDLIQWTQDRLDRRPAQSTC
jgi:acetyl esterase/lipase